MVYRVRKLMETRLNHDSDKVELLERQLREARELAAESDRKFEEVMSPYFCFTNNYSILSKSNTVLDNTLGVSLVRDLSSIPYFFFLFPPGFKIK